MERLTKYEKREIRVARYAKAVALVDEGNLSCSSIGAIVGVAPSTIRNWFPWYRKANNFLKLRERIRVFTKSSKLSTSDIASKFGVSESFVRKWKFKA